MEEKIMTGQNLVEMEFDGISVNESFARIAVAAFVTPLNPTLEELSDIKTAVSEAVTNAIIHGYENFLGYGQYSEANPCCMELHPGKVRLSCKLKNGILEVEVEDRGKGIEDVEKAMEPLYTSKPQHNRSGMGFAFMEAFMDELEVESTPGKGTLVRMRKKISTGDWME